MTFHSIVPSPSTTLIQGWRGGAERGFRAAYTDCIHVLTREATKYDTQENPDIATWYRKILTHNLSPNVLKQRYGILVPITYKQLNPTASRDEMDLAHVLGWCVEMIRAASVMTTGKSLSEALLFTEHGENMLCTKIVLNARNNFCTQHVLPRFELGIFMY